MFDYSDLAKLEKWILENKLSPISRPGNPGNRVTTHLYNIINNNNINIIEGESAPPEAVTLDGLEGVTRVTESGALREPELPRLPEEKALGNQGYPIISYILPRIPQLPSLEGERDIEEEKVFAAQFLDWADSEIAGWPEGTRAALTTVREWFQAKGYTDPEDRILAFVTMLELMRRKGGPLILDHALAELERTAKDVFGPETRLYWA